MEFTCSLSNLYRLPGACAGYSLEQALYTAMTMDDRYWKRLLAGQGGSDALYSRDGALLFWQLARTRFVVQSFACARPSLSPELAELLCHQVYTYQGSSPCFHAKLTILKYTAQGAPDYYRIGVFSKNLVEDEEDQNGIILDGFAAGDSLTGNGRRLWLYLTQCQQALAGTRVFDPQAFQSIQKVVLPADIEVYFNGLAQGKTLGPLLRQDTARLDVFCKAMFVGSAFRDEARAGSLTVWTRAENLGPTHVKLYLIRRKGGGCEYWSGSANASQNALEGQNIECLVKVPVDPDTYREIFAQLSRKGYRPVSVFPDFSEPEAERNLYRTALRAILQSVRPFWRQTKEGWWLERACADPPLLDQGLVYTLLPYELYREEDTLAASQKRRTPLSAVRAVPLWSCGTQRGTAASPGGSSPRGTAPPPRSGNCIGQQRTPSGNSWKNAIRTSS